MSFMDRVQETLNQGLKTSKDLFSKAKDKEKDIGEIGVLKFEIKQLENQAEKIVGQLGSKVYQTLVVEGHNSLSQNTAGVKELLTEIQQIEKRIDEKEKQLETHG